MERPDALGILGITRASGRERWQAYPGLESSLVHDPAVTAVSRGLATQVSIDGRNVGAVAGQSLRGPLLFSNITGHLPAGDHEVGLGATTMRQIGARIGSMVDVTVLTPSGGKRTAPFRVVSKVAFPVLGGVVGLGTGAIFTISGYGAAACPAGPQATVCRQALYDTLDGGILAAVVPGPRGQAVVTHYLDDDRSITALPITPSSLINFGEAVNFPLIFGGILAVFGAATLAHLMVVSVSRRRREIGLLKVLGFVRTARWWPRWAGRPPQWPWWASSSASPSGWSPAAPRGSCSPPTWGWFRWPSCR